MIFFNRHIKQGKEIGRAVKQAILSPFISYGKDKDFVPPPEFFLDEYIYAFITVAIGHMTYYVLGGKDWRPQKKGECMIEALLQIDPTQLLLVHHRQINLDAEKVIKITKSKEFLRGSHDVSTIFGVAYGILKPDDPDPILKKARKIASSETEIMMSIVPKSSENSRLAGAVGFLTLFPHIKKKYL